MRLTTLLPVLALAACGPLPSIHGADRQPDGSLRLTFIGGYTANPTVRGMVHDRLRAQPDGSRLTLGANGCLYLVDPVAVEIVQAKRFDVVAAPDSGCDGKIVLPTTPPRANPGGLIR